MLTVKDKILLSPLWLISKMPLQILFLLSYFVYFVMFRIIGYRKSVVYNNLKNSFPEWDEMEIKRVQKKFFRFLADNFMEILHMLTISEQEMRKRYRIKNPELLQELYDKGKDICAVASHYGNWEWPNYTCRIIPFHLLGVYKPLSNKRFDRMFIDLRKRFDGEPVPMKNTMRRILECRKANTNFILYLVGDQRPPKREMKHWTTFMNQETSMITGPEKLSGKFNMATIFLDLSKRKRGYYEIELKVISENSSETKEHEITEKYIELAEAQIKRQPELYLWSHKRWKHKRNNVESVQQ